MGPANLARGWRSPRRQAGEADLGDGREPLLGVGDELLDACRHPAGLQVLADRAQLALDAAPVLLDAALDAVATLAQLALELGPGAPDLALEPVAGGHAAALVTPQLTLNRGLRAVLGGQALDRRDEVLLGQKAGPHRDQNGPLGQPLGLLDPGLGLRRGGACSGPASGRPGARSALAGGRSGAGRGLARPAALWCRGLRGARVAGGSHAVSIHSRGTE